MENINEYKVQPPQPAPPVAPTTSLQTQIGLYITAALAVAAYVWHTDLGELAAPLSVLAVAVYGAAAAIARAWKQHSYQQALSVYNDQRMTTWVHMQQPAEFAHRAEVQSAFNQVAEHLGAVEAKVDALQPAKKPPRKAAAPRKTTRKSTRPRKVVATH